MWERSGASTESELTWGSARLGGSGETAPLRGCLVEPLAGPLACLVGFQLTMDCLGLDLDPARFADALLRWFATHCTNLAASIVRWFHDASLISHAGLQSVRRRELATSFLQVPGRRLHRGVPLLDILRQNSQGCKVVFDLLKCGQHGLALVRNGSTAGL